MSYARVLFGLSAPTAVVGVHDAVIAPDTPSRAFGVFMFAVAMSLLAGAIGLLRQKWARYGIQFAVVGGLAEGVIALVFFAQQLYYDPLLWKLALWVFVGLLSFGTTVALWYEASVQGVDLFSRLGRRLAAAGGVLLALFQLWYAQEAAPRRAQPSLTVIPTLERLPPRNGMTRVRGSIDMENVSDTRVRIIFAMYAVSGVVLRNTSFTDDEMRREVEKNPGLNYDRNVAFSKTTILRTGPILTPNSFLEPDQKFPTDFLIHVKADTFHLLRLRIVLLLSKADALNVDFSEANRKREAYVSGDARGLAVLHPLVESAWVRRMTHRDLQIELTWVTRRGDDPDVPDLHLWFRSDGQDVSAAYASKLNRLYSLYRLVLIDELAL